VAIRQRPGRHHGEGFLALWASAAPHPDPIVALVMSLLASASVADDCVLAAGWTSARQLRQADLGYPGSALSSAHGSAIKRITAGVKARRWSHRQVGPGDWPSPSCKDSVERKKNERTLVRCKAEIVRRLQAGRTSVHPILARPGSDEREMGIGK